MLVETTSNFQDYMIKYFLINLIISPTDLWEDSSGLFQAPSNFHYFLLSNFQRNQILDFTNF